MVCLLLTLTPLAAQRQMEDIGRGVVASRTATNTAYVSWRLLGHEPADTGFNLYRSQDGAAAVKLNATPILQTTDYVDASANFAQSVSYHVRHVSDGIEGSPSASFTLPAGAPTRQFISISMQKPPGGTSPISSYPFFENFTYLINDISVGDLNGDGEYEYVVKWDPTNARDNSQSGYTGNVILDAYTLAGTRLWRINLGRNIRAGAHYTQFIVYDLDGDGFAEIACKTAPGTIDGAGNAVLLPGHSVNANYRNSDGYILKGPEYLTVFNGGTGAAMATVPYIVPRHPTKENPSGSELTEIWGDGYGNRVDRFLGGVAYLDGQRPSLIMSRGYYVGRTAIGAWDWRNGQLTMRWLFDTYQNPALASYDGQGNHQLSIADVDSDGRDEVVFGSMTVDDNGTGLYSTGLRHGDTLHVSDFDPKRPGLEVFAVHEAPSANGGIGASFRSAATGAILWSTPATSDVGRGTIMDIDPRFEGAEGWASNSTSMYAPDGSVVGPKDGATTNFGVWWEAGPLRQLLDGTRINRWNWASGGGAANLLNSATSDAAQSNGTKATPALSGDIFGDWREEVIWKNTDNTALLVFTTTIPATSRLHTLMHDPHYRVSIAWQNVAYNQPPHTGFFLGHDMPTPPRSPIWKGDLVWRGGSAPQLWSVGSDRFKSSPIATASAAYTNGQSVLFDGSGPATSTIQIEGDISPTDFVVHNPVNHNYTFSGPGQISGGTGLTKSGHGRLTLGGDHSFTGKTLINQGEFRLAGNLTASPVTLQGLGRLTGSGQSGVGLVTEKRSSISPGTTVGNIASIQISGPVTLADTTLEMDLPLSVGQPSDSIAITGDLALTGVNKLVFRISSEAPAPGIYPLVTFTGNLVGALENLTYDPAISPLETQLQISNGAINLLVATPPVSLVWSGSGSVWDKVAQNWLLEGQPQVFNDNDPVSFGPSGAAAPVVTISGDVKPSTIIVDSNTNYTFSGAGTISGSTRLQKSNTGSLTISNANTFTGGTEINGGTVVMGSAAALGGTNVPPSPVTLAGGTWATGNYSPQNPIIVTANSTITGGGSNHGIKAISGSHVLTCSNSGIFDFEGSFAGFNGTISLIGGSSFRLFGATSGPSASFHLGTSSLYSRSSSSANFSFGALAGGPGSKLSGANGYTSAVTYTIGGNHLSTTFGGSIENGNTASNAGNITHIIKTGAGTLTLAGTNTYTGTTTVSGGTLELAGGSLAATATTIQTTGRLGGSGTTAGSVTCHGKLSPNGILTLGNGLTTSSTASVNFDLGSTSDRIAVAGNLTLAGIIEVSAAPGIASGVYPLISYTGSLVTNNVQLVTFPGDFACQLDFVSTPGHVNAIITSTLSAFEQWQILYFGSTDNPLAADDEDPDGDGQKNRSEFIAGTNPNSALSVFKVEITPAAEGAFLLTWPSVPGKNYIILENTTLDSGWLPLHSLVAGPGETTTYLIPGPHEGNRFFMIQVEE
jgi:rhamnogalacturonan endolyase